MEWLFVGGVYPRLSYMMDQTAVTHQCYLGIRRALTDLGVCHAPCFQEATCILWNRATVEARIYLRMNLGLMMSRREQMTTYLCTALGSQPPNL